MLYISLKSQLTLDDQIVTRHWEYDDKASYLSQIRDIFARAKKAGVRFHVLLETDDGNHFNICCGMRDTRNGKVAYKVTYTDVFGNQFVYARSKRKLWSYVDERFLS